MATVTKQMEDNAALLSELIYLRDKKNETKSKIDELNYNNCFIKAINRFKYIVEIHTNKYKKYSNYEDLFQESLIGLTIALNNFNPQRSKNFFKIANWYVKTRVKRAANKYNIINVPMNIAKTTAMHRTSELPTVVDTTCSACDLLEKDQIIENIQIAINSLNDIQKSVVCLYYGIDQHGTNTKKNSISSIAKQMNTSRANIEKILNDAYLILLSNENILNLMQ